MNSPTSSTTQWFPSGSAPESATLRLFCFAHAGGSASVFKAWQSLLPSHIHVCPIQLPGRENRHQEHLVYQLTPLIEDLSTAIVPLLDRPFLILGHSVGALIGFELVRKLHKLGMSLPIHFIASSFRAPQLPDRGPILHNLSEEELISELRCLRGTPEILLSDKTLLAMFLPILRADFSLAETYTYQSETPLACPISVFGGLADQRVSTEELLAWKSQTYQRFSSHFLPGDHFYLFKEKKLFLKSLVQHVPSLQWQTGITI